jgi:hypothetical protein
MGVVYKARQVSLNRVVAIKMILAGPWAGQEELARFHREAESVALLGHPNIVQVYEVGEYQGRPFFSLEFVEGGSLAAKLQDGLPPVRQAVQMVETLARAMHHAHQRGIVHRDLKSANILLTRGTDLPPSPSSVVATREDASAISIGTPKISDFGLAKHIEGDGLRTRSGAILGTPSYMAPEQAEGRSHEVGIAADVYALGAILYELLTGRPPFKGATTLETLDQVRNQEPRPPRQLRADLSRDVEIICLKCLEKDPTKRYANALDLAEDLRRFLADESIAARPVGKAERLRRWSRRHPGWVGLLLGSAAGLALLAAVLWGTAPGELQVLAMDVHHFRGSPAIQIGIMGAPDDAARVDDDLRLKARFSVPAFAYVMAFNTNGTQELLYPAAQDVLPQKGRELECPEDAASAFGLTDGPGLQAIILLASRKQLPTYIAWRSRIDSIPWTGGEGDEFWRFDGTNFESLSAEQGRVWEHDQSLAAEYPSRSSPSPLVWAIATPQLAQARARPVPRPAPRPFDRPRFRPSAEPPRPFREVCEFLQKRSGAEAIRAVAFPVKPKNSD